VVREWRVQHIDSEGAVSDHRLPEVAVVEGKRLTYPPQQGSLLD
jgi:hypothetical protein